MKSFSYFVLLLSAVLVSAAANPAYAMTLEHGETVTIPQERIVEGSLFVAGTTVRILGTVNGDVYCAGQTVEITGTVSGDVLCAGQTVEVKSPVGGSVRVAGQTVRIAGRVSRSVNAFGETVTLTDESVIEGEMLSFGRSVGFYGTAGDDLMAGGMSVTVSGTVDGDTTFYAERLTLESSADIRGALSYTSPNTVSQSPGATVSGNISYTKAEQVKKVEKKVNNAPLFQPFWYIAGVMFFLPLGLLVAFFVPAWLTRTVNTLQNLPLQSLGVGLLSIIFVPAMLLLLLITVLGIPASILFAGVLFWMMLVSRIVVAAWVGRYIITKLHRNETPMKSVLIGVPVLWVIFHLPYVGVFTGCIAMLAGFGSMILGLWKRKVHSSVSGKKHTS